MLKKRNFLIVLSFFLISGNYTTYINEYEKRKTVIVLDPGHGGKDPGSIGNGIVEKDEALRYSLLLKKRILKDLKNVEVILTRTSNKTYLTLGERSRIANSNNPDMFISIHLNSHKNTNISGFEVHTLSRYAKLPNGKKRDTHLSSIETVKRENKIISLDKGEARLNNRSPELGILATIYNNSFNDNSAKFAKELCNNINSKCSIKSRDVMSRGLWVLHKTSASCRVLVELGYISNKEDAAKIKSKKGRRELIDSIYCAIAKYIKNLEKNT